MIYWLIPVIQVSRLSSQQFVSPSRKSLRYWLSALRRSTRCPYFRQIRTCRCQTWACQMKFSAFLCSKLQSLSRFHPKIKNLTYELHVTKRVKYVLSIYECRLSPDLFFGLHDLKVKSMRLLKPVGVNSSVIIATNFWKLSYLTDFVVLMS